MSEETVKKDRMAEAAARALAEAEARRKAAAERPMPEEIGGRGGPEPTRFGDWEKNGLTSDF
ncbi:DUF1674 domain-containing protein [Rhodobacteraceae bacterium NNCM2]|nr:DUF1674 domain-containing protein [Coraliihabitans acroporae]